MRTLIVIDMQEYFQAANDPLTIRATKREIQKSIKKEEHVIVVEYGPSLYEPNIGPTLSEITECLEGYKNYHKLIKEQDDGSPIIFDYINKHQIYSKSFYFCGVNLCYCVVETIFGMKNYYPRSKFTIVADAVNQTTQKSHERIKYLLKDIEYLEEKSVKSVFLNRLRTCS